MDVMLHEQPPVKSDRKLLQGAGRQAAQARQSTWRVPGELDQHLASLSAAELGIHHITALRLEKERLPGDDYQAHRDYLHPHVGLVRGAEETCPGMSAAGQLLAERVQGGERVALFADYDVDGTTSMEIVRRALVQAGAQDGQLICQWASARDGFGLTDQFVRQAAERGASTLVVLDCGSAQSRQVALAQELGMTVIVVDHHRLDPDNPADFHLNPHLASQQREQRSLALLGRARGLHKSGQAAKQRAIADPDSDEAQRELQDIAGQARELIGEMDELSGADSPSSVLKVAIERLSAAVDERQGADPSTGATLAWKLGGEIVGGRQGDWQAQPMYLAALGAMADMADMRHPESRALARVPVDEHSEAAVPEGIRALARHFDEDPLDPGSLIRTRAALNLPKRTVRVEGQAVSRLLGAHSPEQAERYAQALMDDYRQALVVREQMQSEADADWKRRRRAAEQEPFFVQAVLDGHPEDVGQSGVIAGRLAKSHGRPAVVFTEREVDPDSGERLYKFSARNGVLRGAKIGQLLTDKQLQKACLLPGPDGQLESNLGGHADVVSGACTEANLEAVLARFEAFGARARARAGSGKRRRGDVWLTARLVNPAELPQLEEEAALIRPATNGNYPTRISVALRAQQVGELDSERGTHPAQVELTDGSVREVHVAAPAAKLLGCGAWLEAAVSLGERAWWLRDLRPID